MSDIVRNAIVRLVRNQPFYGSLLLQLRRVTGSGANEAVKTACVYARTDGALGLAVNTDFFGQLSVHEQEAVLIHECLHIAHMHLAYAIDEMPQRKVFNLAADVAINQYITGLPNGCIDLATIHEWGIEAASGQTVIYYYERLMQKVSEIEQQLKAAGVVVVDSHEPWEGDDEGLPGQADGSGTGDGDAKDGLPGSGSVPRVLAEAACRDLLEKAIESSKANDSWGTVPNGVKRLIEKALAPKVDWRRELRRYVGDRIRMSTQGTRKKPHRRFEWTSPGRKIVRGARLLVAVDTSGSVGPAELSQFLAEIDGISERAEVIVAEADARVHSVYKYVPRRTQPELRGGGGTSFEIIWWALRDKSFRELRQTVDGIIYLTDGWATWPAGDGGIPTIWVVTDRSRAPTFGKAVYIDVGT